MSQNGDRKLPSPAAAIPGSKVEDDPPKFDWQKKATLIFLGSVGVTLLLTGATGSRMIKKPPTVGPKAPSTPSPVPGMSTSARPTAPPLAFVKRIPGVSAPARKSSSRLRHLFQITPAPAAPLNFVANQHAPWKKELPTPRLLGGVVVAEEAAIPEPAPEDKFNAALDALKAFVLATAITVGSTAGGVFFLSQYLGATDIPTFMHELRHQIMQPFAQSVATSDFLPKWLKLKEKPRTPESLRSEREDEEELRQIFERGWRDFLKQTGQKEEAEDGSDIQGVVDIRRA